MEKRYTCRGRAGCEDSRGGAWIVGGPPLVFWVPEDQQGHPFFSLNGRLLSGHQWVPSPPPLERPRLDNPNGETVYVNLANSARQKGGGPSGATIAVYTEQRTFGLQPMSCQKL